VSCLPVLVLAMGAALAHMIHADQSTVRTWATGLACSPTGHRPEAPADYGVSADVTGPGGHLPVPAGPPDADQGRDADQGVSDELLADQRRLSEVRFVADNLAATGQRVSRRALRAAGLRGSNAELGSIARLFSECGSQLSLTAGMAAQPAIPAVADIRRCRTSRRSQLRRVDRVGGKITQQGAGLESSRDTTCIYNPLVNRRSVVAGTTLAVNGISPTLPHVACVSALSVRLVDAPKAYGDVPRRAFGSCATLASREASRPRDRHEEGGLRTVKGASGEGDREPWLDRQLERRASA
jgi:hypothetical protein